MFERSIDCARLDMPELLFESPNLVYNFDSAVHPDANFSADKSSALVLSVLGLPLLASLLDMLVPYAPEAPSNRDHA